MMRLIVVVIFFLIVALVALCNTNEQMSVSEGFLSALTHVAPVTLFEFPNLGIAELEEDFAITSRYGVVRLGPVTMATFGAIQKKRMGDLTSDTGDGELSSMEDVFIFHMCLFGTNLITADSLMETSAKMDELGGERVQAFLKNF